jgi:hypothetical protein
MVIAGKMHAPKELRRWSEGTKCGACWLISSSIGLSCVRTDGRLLDEAKMHTDIRSRLGTTFDNLFGTTPQPMGAYSDSYMQAMAFPPSHSQLV